MISTQLWSWVAAAMISLVVLSGHWLWKIERRERAKQLRLEAFRGPIQQDAPATDTPWYQQIGSWFGPLVGVVEQQRLVKLLAQAGIKGHTSLASFITVKALTALTLAALAWTLLQSRQLFESWLLDR